MIVASFWFAGVGIVVFFGGLIWTVLRPLREGERGAGAAAKDGAIQGAAVDARGRDARAAGSRPIAAVRRSTGPARAAVRPPGPTSPLTARPSDAGPTRGNAARVLALGPADDATWATGEPLAIDAGRRAVIAAALPVTAAGVSALAFAEGAALRIAAGDAVFMESMANAHLAAFGARRWLDPTAATTVTAHVLAAFAGRRAAAAGSPQSPAASDALQSAFGGEVVFLFRIDAGGQVTEIRTLGFDLST